jgi:cobalt/nickel transport system permease protein
VKDRLAIAAYLVVVVTVTLVHDVAWLTAGLAVALLIAGKDAIRILRRSLLPIALFNLAVSLGYVVAGLIGNDFQFGYLMLVNIRVLLLTFLTFLLAARVDFLRALNFSPTSSYLVVLALSQITTFRRLQEEFRLAGESRRLRRWTLRDGYVRSATAAVRFFDKAEHGAAEIAAAMRSRGFFGPEQG